MTEQKYIATCDTWAEVADTPDAARDELIATLVDMANQANWPDDPPETHQIDVSHAVPHRWGDVCDERPFCDMDDPPRDDDPDALVYSEGDRLERLTLTVRYNPTTDLWEAAP